MILIKSLTPNTFCYETSTAQDLSGNVACTGFGEFSVCKRKAWQIGANRGFQLCTISQTLPCAGVHTKFLPVIQHLIILVLLNSKATKSNDHVLWLQRHHMDPSRSETKWYKDKTQSAAIGLRCRNPSWGCVMRAESTGLWSTSAGKFLSQISKNYKIKYQNNTLKHKS